MGIRKVYRNKGLEFVDMDLGGREISQTYKSPTSRQKVKSTEWLAFVKDRVKWKEKMSS